MKHTLAAFLLAVPTAMLSSGTMGAAGVVEAQVFTPGQSSASAQSGSASSNDALVMLLDQFREMRAELETLRGMVEEQNYEIRNLQRESMDRYTDLDSRLSSLSSSAPTIAPVPGSAPSSTQVPSSAAVSGISPPAAGPSVQTTGIPTPPPTSTTTPAVGSPAPVSPVQTATNTAAVSADAVNASAGLQPTVLSEQQQYQMALDSLLQEEQYQRSVNEFDQYLRLYPDGRFVTNAYYWKGQAYIKLAMLNEARVAFETIVNQYPDGRKVDDAMYSLGTVYDKLGETDRARQLLRQVQSRYPNTSAANLADIYIRSMN